ncbi:lysozyme inhibitor LprI family protein [Phreatobacter sp.]|uniref:lysozyme inhibitor LprI family protein n=1 Tax=Phreatobacter sp. TaxID=1966341 RepID=UPI003F70BC58
MLHDRRAALCFAMLTAFPTASGASGTEIRRIAPGQFPEMRLEATPRTAAEPVEPTPERPFGHCSRDQSNWIFCLQAIARASDSRLDETVDQVAHNLAGNQAFGPFQRQAFERAVREADRRYRALRDHECQALVLSEPDVQGELFEARLTCRIRRNLERITVLQTRYRLAP